MNFSVSALAAGFIFGVFGWYFFQRGRKEVNPKALLIGLAMMVYPYFIENEYLLWVLGVALMFAGFKLTGI